MAADRKYRDSPFAPAADEPLLARVIPLTKRLSGYRADAGRRDLLAGLTVAALALPSGMAYAELAGLSPVNGLYALLLPSVAYALLASSRQVIVGPDDALAVLMAAVVLDAEGLTHVDSTGIHALREIPASLEADGITFAAAQLKAPVQQRVAEAEASPERLHPTVRAAVEACDSENARRGQATVHRGG